MLFFFAVFNAKMVGDPTDIEFVPLKTNLEVNHTLAPVYNVLATATLRLASTTESNPAVQYKRSHVLVYSFLSFGTVAVMVLVAFVVRIVRNFYVLILSRVHRRYLLVLFSNTFNIRLRLFIFIFRQAFSLGLLLKRGCLLQKV